MILHLHRQQRKKKPPTLIPILHDILLEDEMNIWAEKHIGRWRFYLSPRGEGDIVYYFWNRRIVWGVDARSRGTCAHMASCRAQGGGPLWRTEGGGGTIPLIVGRIFKFESRISLGPPAMGHRSQSIRGESSLFLSPSPSISRVTKNRIRAEKKTDSGIFPLSLSLSLLPRNPGCICMRKSRRIENRRILVTFGLSDGRSWKEFLDFRERNELREAWIEEETYDASNLNEISNSFFDRDNKNVFFK